LVNKQNENESTNRKHTKTNRTFKTILSKVPPINESILSRKVCRLEKTFRRIIKQKLIKSGGVKATLYFKLMKLIKDNSLTPIELARLKYRKLYEQQQIFKSERKEHFELSTKNLIFNFLKLIN